MMLLSAAREFVVLTVKVLPFLIVGAVTGAAVQLPLAARMSSRLLGGSGLRPLLLGITGAALLPGCSCATMPMAAGIRESARPRLGTVAAFIFMSPLLSPITVALTWGMLGWQMTLARVTASFAGSLLLGVLINRLEPMLAVNSPKPATSVSCGCGDEACLVKPEDAGQPATQVFWRALVAILRSIAPYFLLGMGIAAAISTFLPENAIPRVLGGASGPWAYVAATLVGVPLYVCEGEEVPITFALWEQGLGSGPSLSFLLGSVGTCIPTILMARSIIGSRATAVYTVFWVLFALGAGLTFQAVSGR